MGGCRTLRALWASCVLVMLAAAACTAQSLTNKVYKFSSGESVQFLGDSASLKYFPAASANCSQCYLAFKLGALSELDAFGQPVAAHHIPDLSNLVPEVTGGQRVSGSVSYQYLTMTFSAPRLPASLHKNNCPSLESIINQAYSAGVGPHDNDLMAKFADEAAAAHHRAPTNLVGQAVTPELAQMSPFGRRLQQFGSWLPSIRVVPPSLPPTPPSSPATPAAAAPTTPSPPAQAPAQGDKAADSPAPSSDSKQAGDNKAPAETPAAMPATETPAAKPAEPSAQKPGAKPAEKPAEQPAEKPAEQQLAEKPKEQQPAPAEQEPAAPPKTEAVRTPAPEPVAAPVAIEPPTSDQLVGQHKKAEEPVPAAADKPAAETPKPAPAAATPKTDAEEKTPAAAAAPQPAEEPKADSDTNPTPPEQDDDSSSSSPAAPAEQPTPVAAPTAQPAPAALGPAAPAPQAADHIHQQLAANNGYLVDPAGSAGQAWGAYPGGNAVRYGAGGYPVGMFGDGPPQLKVTFMFGFSHNKTFAYGRGRVVSAPAGSIKYTIEAQNWPFCSLYNSLKLEVVMASTVKSPQPQFVLSDAADLFEDADSMRGPATRKLHQSEAFTDFMEDRALGGKKGAAGIGGVGVGGLDMLGLSAGPIKKVSTAKLLVGPNLAAATEFPTYAFSSDRFTSESNVSVVLATNSKDAARFSLTFGYFEQGLFYDPTMFFTHKDDMMMAGSDAIPTVPTATLCKNESDCVRGRRRPALQGNSASTPSRALSLQALLSAAAALLVLLVL